MANLARLASTVSECAYNVAIEEPTVWLLVVGAYLDLE